MKPIVLFSLLLLPLTASADTECYTDGMCQNGQQCIWHGPNDSSCEWPSTPVLNCKNCTSNACTLPAQSVDADNDQVPDRLEHQLAHRFFPNLMLREHTQDTGEFYGTIRAGDIHTIPYRIRIIYPSEISASAVCLIFGPCLEIRYGLPYDYDHGDGELGITIGSHEGDSEFMAFVIYSESPQSQSFANANLWKIALARANHHESHTIKSYYSISFYPTFSQSWGIDPPVTMWVAEKKHATYFSQTQCNNSSGVSFPFPGLNTLDDCSENNFNARSSVLDSDRLQNIGEPHSYIDNTIHYPNIASSSSCTEYDVYGYDSFADSTAFRFKFINHLGW